MKPLFLSLSILALLAGCASANHQPPIAKSKFQDPFVADVPGVHEKHIHADFWIKSDMENVLLSPQDIFVFNKNNTQIDPKLYDVFARPDALSKEALLKKVRAVSRVSKFERIYENGSKVSKADWARYERSLNLEAIKSQNPVRFALAVKRTSMRTYPTNDLLFSQGAKDRDIERFQESALFPGDPIAVLHTSRDGKWALVQSHNYIAWVPRDGIAIGKKSQIYKYSNAENFLVITGDKVRTVFNPIEPRVSELQLDMGVRLPLDRPKNLAHNLYGQNPYLSHMVKLPVRNADGTLEFKHALISRKEDVHVGYLPFTQANIIRQAFKFLGERYGWGHRFNGRDCTGFVSEIYKSFGIRLPRNSGDQGRSEIGSNVRYADNGDVGAKLKRLKTGKPGDLIYIPGHVLMLIGQDGGEPFVIHDVHGLGFLKPDGTFYKGTLNGVSVTPIRPLRTSVKTSYLDLVYTIKSIP